MDKIRIRDRNKHRGSATLLAVANNSGFGMTSTLGRLLANDAGMSVVGIHSFY
jgi:hypothetical protein